MFGSALADGVHKTAKQSNRTAHLSRAEPKQSQPQSQRSSAELSVKLPPAQSEPAPSFARSAATGCGPLGPQMRAWAGVASPERGQ